MTRSLNPQNPYDSFAVQASAGTGKTYQLSRRFLNLVGAGADPQEILTITFTVKAAGEMKERIIKEAARLLADLTRQAQFEAELATHFQLFRTSQEWAVKPPRSAWETAHRILSSTQTLRISTIDALFYEWTAKFPWESSAKADGKDQLTLPFKLLDAIQTQEINRSAWDRLFSLPQHSPSTLNSCRILLEHNASQGILGWEQNVFDLFRYCTFLWQTEQLHGEALLSYDLGAQYTVDQVFGLITNELYAIIGETSRREPLLDALTRRDLQAFFRERFFNQEGEVSGNLIRGRKREKLLPQITKVDDVMGQFLAQKKLDSLNKTGQALCQLYKTWISEREVLKRKMGFVEFHDLAMGTYRLFHNPESIGATWQIQRSFQHILIDEFQDTSFLQWSIFRRLMEEVLSGQFHEQGGLPGTVFLVGDKKQSIYGFREAEPAVLDHTSVLLSQFEKHSIPLHESYRSSSVILDFVNRFFTRHIDKNFPVHITAKDESGAPVIPDCGNVLVHEECKANEKENRSAIEEEAEFIGSFLRQALNGERPHPVFDKLTRQFRPLQASDCAILYRTSLHVECFEQALRAHNVPYYREERKGFFKRQEILDCLALFRFLLTPSDIVSLLSILKSPMLGVNDSLILSALDATQKEERRELAILDYIGNDLPELMNKLKHFMLQAFALPPYKLWEEIENSFSVRETYATIAGLEGDIALNNLQRFKDIVISLCNDGSVSLALLLPELETLAEKDEEASQVGRLEAVKLMTIHKAKGLEFPLLVLVETSDPWYRTDRYWSKVQGERPGIAFVGTREKRPGKHVQLNALLEANRRSLREEAERLLYVALTRASQYLVITAHENKTRAENFYTLFGNT
ncbi:MAG: UvrD-helicase domain-containing protein [Deltaproteobacteria bacterium]|nr:UvrD-helicase domain-containing protein [Deltaproteobacteria bacterium]